jgi:hypothetical protein
VTRESRQVRIQSDGNGMDTVITDADGKVIDGVTEASIYLAANELNEVSLTLLAPRIDAHGTVTSVTLLCPICTETVEHECPPATMGGSS